MSRERIKTILIILFLFTDIFLAFSIFTAKKEETSISPDVMDSAVQILKEHNILLDKSVIPAKFPHASVLQADNIISDYESFAKSVLGDGFSSRGDGLFWGKDAELTISGDRFCFKSLENSDISKSYTISEAQKSVFSYLKALGFNISGAKVVSSSADGGICNMKIRGFAQNLPVYSSEIDIAVSSGGVISLSGSWFNPRDSIGEDSSLKSITAILVDFASSYDGVKQKSIKSIELGYSVFDSATYHKSASLIPVTKLTLNGGNEYFLDSRASE
ncbi:MAG: hypothetical protein IK072_04910 [Clostridia bacterium]|nr:hypothetical protein [Clostridia bacterium]